MDISFQTTFSDNAPHCNVAPVSAVDLCNKHYVDSRLVNSGFGINLYLNYSVNALTLAVPAIGTYKQLGTSIVIVSPGITINKPQSDTQLIASFITKSGYPGTVSIPSGIWELNQFGKGLSLPDTEIPITEPEIPIIETELKYYFTLTKINLQEEETLLGTSEYSADINTSFTDVFFAQLILEELTLFSTDQLIINIFSLGVNTMVGATLDSYFQSTTYSYITTPLVSNSNLLSRANIFSGTNAFSSGLSAPTKYFPSNTTDVATTAHLTSYYVNNSGTQSIGGAKTFTSAITGTTYIGTSFGGNVAASSFGTAGYNTTIRGNQISFSNPLTLAATQQPTSVSQLGGVTNGTIQSAGLTLSSGSASIGSLQFTYVGVYIVSFGYRSNSASVLTNHYVNFTGTLLAPVPVGLYGAAPANNAGMATVSASFYILVTTIGTLNMIINLTGTITSFENRYFTATRIG